MGRRIFRPQSQGFAIVRGGVSWPRSIFERPGQIVVALVGLRIQPHCLLEMINGFGNSPRLYQQGAQIELHHRVMGLVNHSVLPQGQLLAGRPATGDCSRIRMRLQAGS